MFGLHFDFVQSAVTESQIEQMQLQTRPAKKSDPRAARHGNIAVELDAIPPVQLRQMVREVVESHIDPVALNSERILEQHERNLIGDWISEFGSSTKKP
jgi:hypothetical protein